MADELPALAPAAPQEDRMKLATSLIAFAIAVAPLFAHAAPTDPVEKPAVVKKVRHRKRATRHIDKPTLEKASAHAKPSKRHKKIERRAIEGQAIAKAGAHDHGDHGAEPGLVPASTHAKPKLTRASSTAKPTVTHTSSAAKPALTHTSSAAKPALTHTSSAHAKPKLEPASVKAPAEPATHKRGRRTSERAPRRATEAKHGGAVEDRPETEHDKLVAIIRGKIAVPRSPAPKPAPPCLKSPVEIMRGPEVERFPLTTCDGNPAPFAVERLSVLARPAGAAKPVSPPAQLAKAKGESISPGVHRVDARILTRVQSIVDHFTKEGHTARISLVSGYRPTSSGSLHATGRALDFHLEGAKNEEVVKFCKTLDDTGCGYYPNSSFVHVDVRDLAAGHVTWIDASGPGETPRYVSTWPPPGDGASSPKPENAKLDAIPSEPPQLDKELAPLPKDEHPASIE
jgi:hypothetical protein